jgi:hypothetical protein
VTISDPKVVAYKFNEIFKGSFSHARHQHFPAATSSPSETPKLSELVCTPADVHTQLRQTKTNKATGSDNLPANLLKNDVTALCASLAQIFNLTLAFSKP